MLVHFLIEFGTNCIVITCGADCMVGFLICITICVAQLSAFACIIACGYVAIFGWVVVPPLKSEAYVKELTKEGTTEETGTERSCGQGKES